MPSARCFACGKPMDVGGATMQELLRFDLTVFCSEQCARSFPYQGTEAYSSRIRALRTSIAGPSPEPLSGKLCTPEHIRVAADNGQAAFLADDVKAAVQWLKDRMRRHAADNEALLQEIDNAFPDTIGSSQNNI